MPKDNKAKGAKSDANASKTAQQPQKELISIFNPAKSAAPKRSKSPQNVVDKPKASKTQRSQSPKQQLKPSSQAPQAHRKGDVAVYPESPREIKEIEVPGGGIIQTKIYGPIGPQKNIQIGISTPKPQPIIPLTPPPKPATPALEPERKTLPLSSSPSKGRLEYLNAIADMAAMEKEHKGKETKSEASKRTQPLQKELTPVSALAKSVEPAQSKSPETVILFSPKDKTNNASKTHARQPGQPISESPKLQSKPPGQPSSGSPKQLSKPPSQPSSQAPKQQSIPPSQPSSESPKQQSRPPSQPVSESSKQQSRPPSQPTRESPKQQSKPPSQTPHETSKGERVTVYPEKPREIREIEVPGGGIIQTKVYGPIGPGQKIQIDISTPKPQPIIPLPEPPKPPPPVLEPEPEHEAEPEPEPVFEIMQRRSSKSNALLDYLNSIAKMSEVELEHEDIESPEFPDDADGTLAILKKFGLPDQGKALDSLLDSESVRFDFGGLMRQYYSYILRSYSLINMQDRYRGLSHSTNCFTSIDISKIGSRDEEQQKITKAKLDKLDEQRQRLRNVAVDEDHFNYLIALSHNQPTLLPLTIVHVMNEQMAPVLEEIFRFYGKNLGTEHKCTKAAGFHYMKIRKRCEMYNHICGGSTLDEDLNQFYN